MFKKNIILILFLFFINCNVSSSDEVAIKVYVDNKIITNIDLKKELHNKIRDIDPFDKKSFEKQVTYHLKKIPLQDQSKASPDIFLFWLHYSLLLNDENKMLVHQKM